MGNVLVVCSYSDQKRRSTAVAYPPGRTAVLRTSSDQIGSTFGRKIPRVLYHTNMSYCMVHLGCHSWVPVVVKFKKQWYTALAGVECIVHTSVVNSTDTPGPGESEELK